MGLTGFVRSFVSLISMGLKLFEIGGSSQRAVRQATAGPASRLFFPFWRSILHRKPALFWMSGRFLLKKTNMGHSMGLKGDHSEGGADWDQEKWKVTPPPSPTVGWQLYGTGWEEG